MMESWLTHHFLNLKIVTDVPNYIWSESKLKCCIMPTYVSFSWAMKTFRILLQSHLLIQFILNASALL